VATLADKIMNFYTSLSIPVLPQGIEVMNPYRSKVARALAKQFYTKFYNDTNVRTLILGINPGRYGGGITGIPFTDPIKLEKYCGIENNLVKKAELSADFIYRMIESYGGTTSFYSRFYISAVSPLGFTAVGKNVNYYDLRSLENSLRDFIVNSLRAQLDLPLERKCCFCLGEGKNFQYVTKLNQKYSFFEKIVPLAHPRFIMQYRRKKIDAYVDDYLEALKAVL
jgi:hypothetical protein